MTEQMMVYSSQLYGNDIMKEYVWPADVIVLDGVAGSVTCPACCVGHDYNDTHPFDYEDGGCVECKNTGRIMVSI